VRLRGNTVRNATVIPQAAVQRGPRQNFVYLIDQDGLAHRQPVTIGYNDETGSVVTVGISPGDRVVVDGASRLTDGAKVSVVAPDADTAATTGINRPTAPGTKPRNGQGG
jgi:membrane fusion protein, multidrug efflux system